MGLKFTFWFNFLHFFCEICWESPLARWCAAGSSWQCCHLWLEELGNIYAFLYLFSPSYRFYITNYSFTLRICQCLFARLVMNLIKREDNDWKIPAPLHHLPGVNIEVNYGLEVPHTQISRNNYKNIEQSRGVSGPLLTLLWSMATICCLCYIPFHFHCVSLRMFSRRSQNFRKTET